jgi:hypothetical protein
MSLSRAGSSIFLAVLCACSRAPGPAASTAKASPSAPADAARPLPSPVPDVVARVNGRAIHLAQIVPLAKAELDRVSVKDRDAKKPEVLRRALQEYIDRELLVEAALARGVEADTRAVDFAYDQMRHDHPDDAEWSEFLAGEGMDPQALRAELRAQQTVAVLLDQVIRAWPVPEEEARAAYQTNPSGFGPAGQASPPRFEDVRAEVEMAVRVHKSREIREAFLKQLRAKASVEVYL